VQLWNRFRDDVSQPSVPVGRDLFLPIAALVIVAVAQWTDAGTAAELVGLVPAVGALVLLGWGVRVPLELVALLVIVPSAAVVGHQGNLEGALFLPVLACLYCAWHMGSTVRAACVAVAAATSSLVVADVFAPEAHMNWTPWTAANAFTFAMGLTLRSQRALIDQLQEARGALAEQAVAEERRRIARELHDLAGHTLASMVLHVTGARHVLHRDPAEAERALEDAEQVGRTSLDQIRATVAALRTDERGTDAALATSAEVPDLVDSYRRAGLRVDLDVDPAASALEGPLGTAVHRIIQEALANIARHAPTNRAAVSIRTAGGEVRLRVEDHGRPPAPGDGSALHFGVVGMRERARALGGELSAGPHDHGWKVEAHLPLPAAGATS
jgi:signal transduction histidine kinase